MPDTRHPVSATATVIVAAAFALGTACTSLPDSGAASPANDSTAIRVMSFNIEWGGTHVSFDNVVAAIRQSSADIVGVQEAEGNLGRLAERLGWYADERSYVISRFPVIRAPGANGDFAYVEVAPGRAVAVANVHLPSDPYGPDAVRDGADAASVLALERRTRLPAMERVLDALRPVLQARMPLFLTGDFNTPAHTDWVPAAVGTRPYLRYALDWPVTRAVAAAGLRDAWREIHPDPVAYPGLTWWAARPPLALYAPGPGDAQDRIDYIWYAGPVTVRDARLAGEPGGPSVALGVSPWPSDHRAVIADAAVVPAALPSMAMAARRVIRQGERVALRYFSDGANPVRITVRNANDDVVADRHVTGSGSVELEAGLFAPGRYDVVVRGESAAMPQRSRFWVLATHGTPRISVRGRDFASGEAIDVQWRNGPGFRNDYIAVYPAGTEATYDNGLAWTYVDALPEGESRLDARSAQSGWPLAPGRYVARLMKDDGRDVLAESGVFHVR